MASIYDARKELRWSQLKVGVVVSLALLMVFLTVFFSGVLDEVFARRAVLRLELSDVNGLTPGAPVWLLGVSVGSVSRVEVQSPRSALVTLRIDPRELRFIRKDARASVLASGLLGDRIVQLAPGSPSAPPVASGDLIAGESSTGMQEILTKSATAFDQVTTFGETLKALVRQIEVGAGSASKFIRDPALYDDLTRAVDRASAALDELRRSRGTLRALERDPDLYRRLVSSAAAVEAVGRTLSDQRGTLAKLAHDPTLYVNLNAAAKSLATTLKRLDRTDNAAGALLHDRELASDLKETMRELRLLIADVKARPRHYFTVRIF